MALISTLKIGISSNSKLIKAPQIPLSSRFPSQVMVSYSKSSRPNLSFNKSGSNYRNSLRKDVGFAISQNPIERKKLAVFVSGGGSNFRSIHEAIIGGLVHGDVVVLVTDKPNCGGAEYARTNNIPIIIFPKNKSSPEGLSHIDLVTTLREYKVDFILLAGYLKLIPAELVQAYPRSILNIHPSLLPAFGGKGFYGLKVHKAVVASGARYSGPTVHFVDENFDTGRILAQRVVPVLSNDTAEELASRVLNEEHKVTWRWFRHYAKSA